MGTGTSTRGNVNNLLYWMNGSVSGVLSSYWIEGYKNVQSGTWDDASTVGDRYRNQIFFQSNAFAKDDYKVTRRLTLNLGVRWEYYGPQHSANPNLESNFYFGNGNTLFERIRNGQVLTTPNSPDKSLWKAQYKNFAPRLGFALDVLGNGRLAVRGGYGISYERNFGNVTYNVRGDKEVVIEVAALRGKGYPAPVNLTPPAPEPKPAAPKKKGK